MAGEKWIDVQKAKKMYEEKRPESLSRDILDEWSTNRITNPKQAQMTLSIKRIESCLRGVFMAEFSGEKSLTYGVETANSVIDGRRLDLAINAEGQTAIREQKEKESFIDKLGA